MKSILLNIDFLFPWDEVYWRRKEQGIFCRELYIVLLSMLCYLVKGVNVLFSPFKLWSEEPQGDDMLTLGTTVCISPVVFSRPKFINHPKMYRSIWDQGTNLSNHLDYTEDFRSKFHDFSSGTQSKNSQYLATSSVGGDCHLTPPHLEWSTSHETIYTILVCITSVMDQFLLPEITYPSIHPSCTPYFLIYLWVPHCHWQIVEGSYRRYHNFTPPKYKTQLIE